MMQLKFGLFLLLVLKPLAIVALSIVLNPSPSSAPTKSNPIERKELHNQWVQKLLEKHHKLTGLKLIYTRLPLEKKNHFDQALNEIEGLYQTAVKILTKLEEAENQQWQALPLELQKISHQIERGQDQLETNLTPYNSPWVYQI